MQEQDQTPDTPDPETMTYTITLKQTNELMSMSSDGAIPKPTVIFLLTQFLFNSLMSEYINMAREKEAHSKSLTTQGDQE